jgi:hypothetical protein
MLVLYGCIQTLRRWYTGRTKVGQDRAVGAETPCRYADSERKQKVCKTFTLGQALDAVTGVRPG